MDKPKGGRRRRGWMKERGRGKGGGIHKVLNHTYPELALAITTTTTTTTTYLYQHPLQYGAEKEQ